MMPNCFSHLSCAAIVVGAGIFLAAGCRTPHEPNPMAEAAASGERPVAMKGASTFFDGKVAATVTISRGFSRQAPSDAKVRERGIGGGHGDASTTSVSENYPVSYEGASEEEQKEMYEDMVRIARARRAAGSPMPPVTIRLKLENHGDAPVDVEILEVNSDLGNFAVRPKKLTLAAAQLGETEPMVSQLGVTSDEIPMKVTLRVAGKKEDQVIPVKSVIMVKEKK